MNDKYECPSDCVFLRSKKTGYKGWYGPLFKWCVNEQVYRSVLPLGEMLADREAEACPWYTAPTPECKWRRLWRKFCGKYD